MSDKMVLDQQWLDTANDIDQTTVEVERQQYPYIQYVNGNRQLKVAGGVLWHGGWALPCANIDAETLPGWTRGALEHGTSQTDVWLSREITVSMIRNRKAWTVFDGQQNLYFPWVGGYDKAKLAGHPRGKLQTLVYVKGLESHGVYMLTLRGSFAQAFTDKVMPEFVKYVITPANAANAKRGLKNKFPLRSFWLTLGPQHELDGGPHFVEVGVKPNSSLVVLPMAIGLSDKLTMANIGKLFVGKDLLAASTVAYTDAEGWATALEQSQPVAETVAAASDGGVEEIPF